jgi:ubiquinone/menaquinone biosynthesis C-methylase UbiE
MGSTASQFVGGVPDFYDRYLGPVIFNPYAVDLAKRLWRFAGNDVLEIACGTGVLTDQLHQSLPQGTRLVATDLNQGMLDIAQRRVPDPRVSWKVADGAALPFEDRSFDLVVCQFGVMFFPDKLAGIREARRVLRESGRYVFNVWDAFEANPFGRIAHQTIASFFPSEPPRFYQTPFGFSDESTIRSTLRDAGFRSTAIEWVSKNTVSANAHDFAVGLVRGNPVIQMIEERGTVDPEEVIRGVEQALVKEGGDQPFRSTMRALVVTAKV